MRLRTYQKVFIFLMSFVSLFAQPVLFARAQEPEETLLQKYEAVLGQYEILADTTREVILFSLDATWENITDAEARVWRIASHYRDFSSGIQDAGFFALRETYASVYEGWKRSGRVIASLASSETPAHTQGGIRSAVPNFQFVAASAEASRGIFEKARTALREWLGVGQNDAPAVVPEPAPESSVAVESPNTQTQIERITERIVEQPVSVTQIVSSEGVSLTDVAVLISALRADLEPQIERAMGSPRQSDRGDSDTLSIEDGPDGYLLSSTGTGIEWVATSSLGISGGAEGFSTTSAEYWKSVSDFFSTTSSDYWKSVSNFFSTTSADYWLTQQALSSFSTTSADYWQSVRNFFSTTSSDYWKSVSNFFSTTSADYWLTQQTLSSFSTTSAEYFINASSTIANAEGVASGNVLQWNGTRWVSAATSTLGQFSQWVTSGSDIYYSTGNVGIGTSTAEEKLTLWGLSGEDYKILFGEQSTKGMSLFYEGSAGSGTANKFHIRSELPGDERNIVTFTLGGSMGLGTSAPYEQFEMASSGPSGARMLISNGGGANRKGLLITSPTPSQNYARMEAYDYGASAGLPLVINNVGGGNVGIGTTTPGYKLTVAGDAMLTGALQDNTYSAGTDGMVLQTTGTGIAWVATSSLNIIGAADGSFSTTSADYWKSVSDFFSTTSSDYWASVTNFFSTTSSDYWKSVNNFFSTTSAEYFINASSTIANAGGAIWGDVLYWNGARWAALATSSLGISGGTDTWVDAGSYVYPSAGDYVEVPYINATSTTATSTFTNAEMLSTATLNGQTIEYWNEVPLDDPYKLKDWFDGVQGAGRIKGGEITPNLDGTVDITAGEGLVHTVDAGPEDNPLDCTTCGQISPIEYTNWATTTSLVLADNAYNYIYYDYETGTIKATTDFYSISFTREFTLGRAYRRGNDVVVRLCGTNIWNFNRRVQLFGEEVFPIMRASGMTISEVGTRGLAVTGGVLWAELVNRFTTDPFTTASDSFSAWHRNGVGGWTETTGQTQLSNTLYDDGDGTLGTVTNNRYAVHFIYVVHDSTVHSVYGQVQNYTLNEAEAAQPPASIPGILGAYGTLIGKVIILKNATNFTEIQSAFQTVFAGAGTIVHNDTSGLQGGAAAEYYHLTAAEYTGTGTGVFVRQNNPILTGNIGIGTTSPYAKLAIHANNGETNQNLFVIASSTSVATTTHFVVRNDGNVGIGSSTPNSLLTVAGTSSLRTILPEANLTYNLGSSTKRWNEAWVGTMNIGTSTWSINNGSNGRLSIYDNASGGGTERLSILTSGYVGIGTTTPTSALTVDGTSTFAGQIVSSALPSGVGVSQGVLYVNPKSFTSAGVVAWSQKSTWNLGDIGGTSAVGFADLDGDGDLDMIAGRNEAGVLAYENTGTAQAPSWTAKSEWGIPGFTYGRPALADLDGDRDYDLILGKDDGVGYAYENTGSASSPIWTAKSEWNTPDVGSYANVALADLDGDGDYDALIGPNSGGYPRGLENIGTPQAPVWAWKTSWNVPANYNGVYPAIGDLDGDGDYDVLVGNNDPTSRVRAYENTGTAQNPVWTLRTDWYVPEVASYNEFPALGDLDGDGDLDVLVGTQSGVTYAYENTGSVGSVSNTLFGVAVDGSERFRISGNSITASGFLTLNNYLNLTYSGTQAAATISQNGTGDILNIFDGVSEAFTILDGGNVGIGSSTPNAKLSLKGSAGTANIFQIASSTDEVIFTVTGTGNVGIGTTSPYAKLSVAGLVVAQNLFATSTTATSSVLGDLAVGTTTTYFNTIRGKLGVAGAKDMSGSTRTPTNQISIVDTSASAEGVGGAIGFYGYSGSNLSHAGAIDIYKTTAETTEYGFDMRFLTRTHGIEALQEVARFTSGGFVGIGTSTPQWTLSVTGTAGFEGLTAAAGTPDALCLSATGELTVNTGAQTCTVSSLRFKHDVTLYESGLETINLLSPSVFVYNDATQQRIGLIAEDVALVDERLIFREEDGTPRGVRYEDIVAVLVRAVQELSVKLDELLASAVQAVDGIVSGIRKLYVQEELCIGETCVNEVQLRTLLENANITPTPPVQEQPVEEPPAEEPPVEEPPAEEPPVEGPSVEELPAEEPPTEEPPVEEPPAEEPQAEELPSGTQTEAPAEEAPLESEPSAGE